MGLDMGPHDVDFHMSNCVFQPSGDHHFTGDSKMNLILKLKEMMLTLSSVMKYIYI